MSSSGEGGAGIWRGLLRVWCAGVMCPPWEGWKLGVGSHVFMVSEMSHVTGEWPEGSLLVILFKMASQVVDLCI